jgi:small subunit ribosomal protein S1
MFLEENPGSSGAETAPQGGKPATTEPPTDATPPDAEIGELLAGMEKLSEGLTPGTVVRGQVLKVTDSDVLVDVGLKSEAAIPRSEFDSGNGELCVKPGDTVDIWVEDYDEVEGTATLSHRKAARSRAWDRVEQAFRDQANVTARVVERTKGGLTVDVGGIRAFLPGSQVDVRPFRDLDSLVGQEISCKVIKVNKARNNVVVSRKQAVEEELQERKAKLLERLAEGAVLEGRVKNLTEYGAFVDLGGMDGLLHVTDMTWGRVGHPSDVVQVGQELRVKVLKYDPERGRVSLGLKQLTPDPWERVSSTYHVGDRVNGRVVSLTDYGAFVELEPGVEGLIHVSEMTWSKRPKHPSKIVNVGDRVEVAILEVNPAQRRISLSLKQTLADPWATLPERLQVGTKVQGRVRNLTDFGAFIEIEDGIDGLVHISDLSWTKTIKHPSEVLKKGQKVEALVLSLDAANRRISLGLKQLQPDVREGFFSQVQVGDIVRGRVVRMAQFGAFVELEEGVEGLCHISEMDEDQLKRGPHKVQIGAELDFRVLRLNPIEKKIALSLRDVEQQPRRPPASANQGDPTSSVQAGSPAEAMGSAASTPEAAAKAQP